MHTLFFRATFLPPTTLLAPLDSTESAELIYWVCVEQMTSDAVVGWSLAISPTSGWGIVTKLSGYISGMV